MFKYQSDRDERGFAEMFHYVARGDIKVMDGANANDYIWNPRNALWESVPQSVWRNTIIDRLEP